jgi:hypothetical protein
MATIPLWRSIRINAVVAAVKVSMGVLSPHPKAVPRAVAGGEGNR